MLASRNPPPPGTEPPLYTHIPSPRSSISHSIAPSRASMDSNITHVPFSMREEEVFYDPVGNGEKVRRGSSLLRTLSRGRKDKGAKVERNASLMRGKDGSSVEGEVGRKGSIVKRLRKRLSLSKESSALVSPKSRGEKESEFGDKEEMILLDQAGDEMSYHPQAERAIRQKKPLPDASFTSSPPPKRTPTWRRSLASSILGPTSHSTPQPMARPPSRSQSPFSRDEAKPTPRARDPFTSPPRGEERECTTKPLRVGSRSAGKREIGKLSSPPNPTRSTRQTQTPQPFKTGRFLTADQILDLPLPPHTPQGLPSRYRPGGTTIFDVYPDEEFDYHPNPFENGATAGRGIEAYSLYDISHYTAENSLSQRRPYHHGGKDPSVDWGNPHEMLLDPSPSNSARSSLDDSRRFGDGGGYGVGEGDVKYGSGRRVPLKYEKVRRSGTVTSTKSNMSTSSKGSILGLMGPIMM
ncbi:hypothetical protein B9479_005574 [Cryptococcus floricola]|uniref:Uncharacterized protein n=1 Tax=Cryptococcus floricola TaxID=2591691 RepID=A0A5D3AUH3_9TREE|nr:hypothetical protein B9479_005574 [Cryptococcus floricola]